MIDKITSLNQFQIVLFASKDKRLSDGDISILAEIVDRYKKFDTKTYPTGDGHLMRETGRAESTVKASKAKLIRLGYITVDEIGRGSAGTTYVPNFAWQSAISGAVEAEIKKRGAAKVKNTGKAAHKPSKGRELVGVSTAPPVGTVGAPAAPLRDLVVPPDAPQTYLEPKRLLNSTPTLALAPCGLRGVHDELFEITNAYLDEFDGGRWVAVEVVANGENETLEFLIEASKESRQREGQRIFEGFVLACGINDRITEPSELIGKRFTRRNGEEFLPAPANDNQSIGELAA